jgi:hypothetical protein
VPEYCQKLRIQLARGDFLGKITLGRGLPRGEVRVWVSFMASIKDYIAENNEEAVAFPDLESALIGVGNQYTKKPLLIYSAKKILEKLMKDGLTYEEAMDHYGTNIQCLWAGEGTPIIIDDLSVDLKEINQEHESTDTFIKGESHALTPRGNQGGRSPPTGKDIPRVQSRVRSVHHRRN